MVNGLIADSFAILGIWEGDEGDAAARPGTWDHCMAIAPPYLTFWTRSLRPDAP